MMTRRRCSCKQIFSCFQQRSLSRLSCSSPSPRWCPRSEAGTCCCNSLVGPSASRVDRRHHGGSIEGFSSISRSFTCKRRVAAICFPLVRHNVDLVLDCLHFLWSDTTSTSCLLVCTPAVFSAPKDPVLLTSHICRHPKVFESTETPTL